MELAQTLEVAHGGPAAAEWVGVVEGGDVVELAACGGSVAAGEAAVFVAESDGGGGEGVGSVDQCSVGERVASDGFAEGGVGGDGGFECCGQRCGAEVDA
ncbi:MAG: hypothetical protein WBG53_22285 [Rhodococcus sp. (in: high G+C Gram-positive bacteria)]|uniref:hypothetical protein n=1 Tax=unclassified Rhodococcus (in: high G+C Gram-positive bacteria) TaxID=192944 RepID=UPI000EF8F654|nr:MULTISPECIES: hypothetical protein [unclassified Rhodococcus (in: high G+C Gram-positive bacteria)]RMB78358.1 hypothetical protein AYK61_19955 [Rhodococcus sp. SBT000017]